MRLFSAHVVTPEPKPPVWDWFKEKAAALFFACEQPRVTRTVTLTLVAIGAMLLLFGCSFLQSHELLAKTVVQTSVAKFAEQSSDAKRDERLARIIDIATSVKAISGDDQSTLNGLASYAKARVATSQGLSPIDVQLANNLIDVIAAELQAKIGDGLLKPDDAVLVSKAMDWIIEAANTSRAYHAARV